MKRYAIVAALAILGAACGDDNPTSPSDGPVVFTVALAASNEVPPVANADRDARGTATITITVPRDSAGIVTGPGTANFSAQVSGFPAGTVARAAHIHPGATGVNGTPLVDTGLTAANPITLGDGAGTLTFSGINISQVNAQAILNNPAGFYFNIHTVLTPGGAVRGQLVRQ
jgi:hypothetical protein